MNKKRIIGLILWGAGIILYFVLEGDVATVISGVLVAVSIPLLLMENKKPEEKKDE